MDGDSIIFTYSYYSDMYENGGRYYAHRTLDTLLATRNIIFVGFGLTDSDFLRIMDRITVIISRYCGNWHRPGRKAA